MFLHLKVRGKSWVYFFLLFSHNLFAQPGKDGNYTVTATSQVLNKYCPISSNISSGSSTLIVANSIMVSLCAGDLVMVYQAQGASLNYTNTSSYGDITSYNSAGLYEFKYVQNVNGNTITTQTTFTNSYSTSGYIQLIKVPQYQTLTISSGSSLSAKAWKDTSISSMPYRFGGLVVVHTSSIVNNGIITAAGSGFRGGAVFYNSSVIFGSTAFTSTNSTLGGEKGEGVGGHYLEYDANGGRYCMGAPGNGGGGGDNHNSGGGGGANGYNGNTWTGQGVMIVDVNNPTAAWSLSSGYISNGNALTNSSGGGHGGYTHGNFNANALVNAPGTTTWTGDYRREVGGIGGRPLSNINPESRIYFGGGGGSADANNNASASGSNGGGIVYLIATGGISGSGIITAAGIDASNTSGCSCDAAPGAGAGGSIVLKVASIASTQTVNARGGNGGSQLTLSSPGSQSDESEGPGGGGGGGFVAISSSGVTPIISGGLNGTSASGAVTEMTSNGATNGGTGQTATVSANFISFLSFNTLTISSNNPICAPATLSLSVVSTGTTSYSWSGPAFNSTLSSPTRTNTSASMSGVYSVTLTNLNCISTGTVSISVYQHTLSTTTTSVACNGFSTAAASVSVLGGSGNYTYTWTGSSQTNSTVSGLSAGFYTVSVTDVAASCVRTTSLQINQAPALNLSISPSTVNACVNENVIFSSTLSGGTPGYSYSWTPGSNASSVSVSQSSAGTSVYTLTITDANNCSISQTASAIFFPSPLLSAADVTICPGSTATLSISGGNTYTWFPNNVQGSVFTDTPISSGIYTVIGTSAMGCSAIITPSVFVKPSVTLSFVTATINCANLGSATVTANGTSGPFSYSWMPVSQSSSIATGLYPGTYTVNVFDASTGCAFSPTTHFSPLVPLSGTVSSTPNLQCHGATTGTAEISLSGGSGNQNYVWQNLSGTQTSSTAIGLAGGVSTVTITDALTFCTLTKTFVITQPLAFTLNIGTSSPSVCLGGSISFTASNSGGTPAYSYTWQNSANSDTFIANESTTGSHIYTVISTDANNCLVSNTVNVNFVPNPTLSAVPSVSICPLETGTLIVSGANTYSWSNGQTSPTMSASPLLNTSYTVVGSTSGCSTSAVGSIILKALPTVTFVGSNAICQGETLTLFNPNTSASYLWTGPMNYTSNLQSISINSIAASMSGNYVLKVTASNGCTASISQSVTVHPTPSLSISAATVCQGQNLQFNSSFLSNGTYLWTGSSFSSSLQNPVLLNANPGSSGTYTLVLTSVFGCSNSAVTQASVIATPSPVITATDHICAGNNLALNASGGNSYAWFGPLGFYNASPTPTLNNITIQNSGSYTLFAYVASCPGMTTKSITVHAPPQLTLNSNSPVCENAILNLSAGGANTYSWTGPGGYAGIGATVNLNQPTLLNAGVYTLNAADNYGCSNQSQISVSILSSPSPVVKQSTVCFGGTATLTASGGASYFWQGPAGFSSTLSAILLPNVSTLNIGNYTVTTTGNNACSTITVVPLTGFNLSIPSPTVLSSERACLNSSKELVAIGGKNYYWLGPNNFSAIGPTVTIPNVSEESEGIYTITVVGENNCSGSGTIHIESYPPPTGTLSVDIAKLCVPSKIRLGLSSIPSVTASNIYIDNQLLKSNDLTYFLTTPGTYPVFCFFTDTNGCVGSSSVNINAYPVPVADFLYTPEKPITGLDKVNFINTTYNDYDCTWQWFLKGSHNDTLYQKDPTYVYPQAGTYPVVLIATNKWGCKDTVIRIIEINGEFNLYVPNAFSPNGDNLNDIFIPKGEGIIKYRLEVYDRWGEKIFLSDNLYLGWDGTFRGKECKTEVYTWTILLTNSLGEHKHYSGHVSLLRGQVISD
ncbi:MAG: gliding motility-associated C-terminal domain-containing protein [Bacteroidia bacterium]|nr:gliding motility-associated C-terminal domain-containing protein [Bacteroidia bacterium]